MLFGNSSHDDAHGGVDTIAERQGVQDFSQSFMSSATPDDAQAPLVPMPVNSSMMPGTALKDTTTSMRIPVYVPGSSEKSAGARPPKTRRATVVNIGVCVLLVAILLGTLIAVLPAGTGQASGLQKIFNPSTNVITSKKSDTALIAAQAATATAVTQDGYDAGNQAYNGVQSGPAYTTSIAPQDAGSLNRFFYGQCTYWANMRYHQLTGHWVPWLGNAYQWAYQAPNYGWQTSSYPNPNGPSIIVLAPYTQGAGGYGHVAVVETGVSAAAAAKGVVTSNWNWNGHWAAEDWVTFYPGAGVTFIWY